MTIYKAIFHVCAFFQRLFLVLIYGNRLTIGKKVTWRRRLNIMIANNARIVIGNNCFFNNDCSLNAMNFVSIGDGTILGENVKIYDHNHKFSNPDIPIKEQGFSNGTIYIGEHCWIGSNVVILKGANIGDNCVIGAGTIISTDIESGCVVKNGGNLVIERVRRD